MLPPTCTGDAGLAQDVADQAGGGGLAVGAGDADGAALEERRGQFDFADHARRRAGGPPRAARDRPERRARARSDRGPRRPRASAGEGDAEARSSSRARQFVQRLQVGGAHLGALRATATPPTPCRTSSCPPPARCLPSRFIAVSAWSARTAPAPGRRSRSAR